MSRVCLPCHSRRQSRPRGHSASPFALFMQPAFVNPVNFSGVYFAQDQPWWLLLVASRRQSYYVVTNSNAYLSSNRLLQTQHSICHQRHNRRSCQFQNYLQRDPLPGRRLSRNETSGVLEFAKWDLSNIPREWNEMVFRRHKKRFQQAGGRTQCGYHNRTDQRAPISTFASAGSRLHWLNSASFGSSD
jgi:hypothetical protein